MWRQKKYPCGEILDIEIFPRPENVKPLKRAKREKESSPAQRRLNNKNASKYFIRLVHKNYSRHDFFLDLTIAGQFMPKDRKGALKLLKNYIARVNRWRKAQGLSNLKYIYVLSEFTELRQPARFHFHMIVEKMDVDILKDKWGMGYANIDTLEFNEYGVEGKAKYMARQASYSGCRTWGSSVGLKKPEAIVSDKAITKTIAARMENAPEDRAFFEKLYPGWFFTSCTVEYNLITGIKITIKMRKEEVPDYIDKRLEKQYREYVA